MYVLSAGQVVKCGTDCSIAANRAYIDMSQVGLYTGNEAGVKALCLAGDDATAITSTPATPNGDDAIYNIGGQRVDNGQRTMDNGQLSKGLYIVRGKKVVVK